MSTSVHALHEETQKELQKWKNRYSTLCQENEALNRENDRLYQENEGLKAAMAKYIGNDEPPAKRKRLGIPTNPLELPEPCAMRILRFLPPIDLLKATEVSKHWKLYIESGSKLMKRAMNGTVVNINFDQKELLEFISSEFQREYKHMKISSSFDYVPRTLFSSLLFPAIKRSSTLETLRASFNFEVDAEFFEQKFPNLVKLELKSNSRGSPFKKVPKFPFPELTTLKIEGTNRTRVALSTDRFEQFLRAFSKLKHLQIKNVGGYHFLHNDNERSIPELVVKDPTQPKLETIVLSARRYTPKFLRSHQNSLTKLMIDEMSTLSLSLCLRDLKQLKFLTVGLLEHNGNIAFPQNESIENFTIDRNHLNSDQFHPILIAIPSLKELTVKSRTKSYYNDSVDIRFLAANMRNLKWYKTAEISDDDREVYHEVKQNANHYINTSFELANDEDVDYDSFKELKI